MKNEIKMENDLILKTILDLNNDFSRKRLLKIRQQGDYNYAASLSCAARIKKTQCYLDYEEKSNFPNMENIFFRKIEKWDSVNLCCIIGEYIKKELSLSKSICESCDGAGIQNCMLCSYDHPCSDCDCDGFKMDFNYNDSSIIINKKLYQYKTIEAIIKIAKWSNLKKIPVNDANNSTFFKINNIEIVVMPMKKGEQNEI